MVSISHPWMSPCMNVVGVPVPTEVCVTLFTPGQTAAGKSQRRRLFPSALDGRFTFDNVGDGMHILDVEAVGFYFPTIKIIKHGNLVKATASDVQDRPVEYPLTLAPLKRMEYFEQKQKFNVMKWLKTPYGIMIAFGVGSLVLLPMLKVDPEEYRQMKEMTSMSGKKE